MSNPLFHSRTVLVFLLVLSSIVSANESDDSDNSSLHKIQRQVFHHYERGVVLEKLVQQQSSIELTDESIPNEDNNNSVTKWNRIASNLYAKYNYPLWEAIRCHAILHESISKSLASTGCRNKNKKHVENMSSCSKHILDLVTSYSANTVLTAMFPGENEETKVMMRDAYRNALVKTPNQQETKDIKHARYIAETAAFQTLMERYLNDGTMRFVDYKPVMGVEGRWTDLSLYCTSNSENEGNDLSCNGKYPRILPLNRFANSRTYSFESSDTNVNNDATNSNLTKVMMDLIGSMKPPSLFDGDGKYSTYHIEVMQKGDRNSNRTKEEVEMIEFHNLLATQGTTLSVWMSIAEDILRMDESVNDSNTSNSNFEYTKSMFSSSSLFTLISKSLYDTVVITSKMKIMYDTWRPWNAIHKGVMGNPRVPPKDESWRPLESMLFDYSYDQEYPSLYCACTSAFVDSIRIYLEKGGPVLVQKEGEPFKISIRQSNDDHTIIKTYESFRQIKQEAEAVSILTGSHFGFSTESGHSIGTSVVNNVHKVFCKGRYCR
jgi:hypothetical protein